MNSLKIKLPNGMTLDLKNSKSENLGVNAVTVVIQYSTGFISRKHTLIMPGKLKDVKIGDLLENVKESINV